MSTATLSTKGQLVIPTRFRRALSLEPTNALVLQNLETVTTAALTATRAAIQQKGSDPPPDTPETIDLQKQLDAVKRLRARGQ